MEPKRIEKERLSGRNFLRAAAFSVSATALTGFGSRELGATQLSEIRQWDYQAEIVILGVGGAGLTAAIMARAVDAEFDRPAKRMASIQSPPYYAIEVFPSFFNTQGGPRRNKNAQILDTNRKPIPRLYSAGEMGSIFSFHCQGGGNVAECLAFGRVATERAVAVKAWS